jgi:hypothetical protein
MHVRHGHSEPGGASLKGGAGVLDSTTNRDNESRRFFGISPFLVFRSFFFFCG